MGLLCAQGKVQFPERKSSLKAKLKLCSSPRTEATSTLTDEQQAVVDSLYVCWDAGSKGYVEVSHYNPLMR